jgi:predicted  nucleic acid-binding Zn-ribbon protein
MECATKVELESQKKELSYVQFSLTELRGDYEKSLGVMDGLSKSQYHQSERIGAMESAMAGKIDRAEVDHLQSLVAKVMMYDAFKTDTLEALKRLHRFRDESLQRYEDYDQHLQSLDDEVRQAQEALSRTATKRDLHQLAKELQGLEQRLLLCASNDALSEVGYSVTRLGVCRWWP